MKVFTEVKETQITNKTETKKYMSYDGKLFSNEKSCRDYESALTKANTVALVKSSDCKIVCEFDIYNSYAGSEEYYYLVAKVTKDTKVPLETIYNAFHCNDEVSQLEFKKTLEEGVNLVFGLGCCDDLDEIDDFEDFYDYGTVEDFKKKLSEGFSLLDLD
jgi:hypothetical protein